MHIYPNRYINIYHNIRVYMNRYIEPDQFEDDPQWDFDDPDTGCYDE